MKFVNIINSINNLDLNQLVECNYIYTPIICNILKSCTSYCINYFIKEFIYDYEVKLLKKLPLLDTNLCFKYFFCEIENPKYNFCIDNFLNENFYSKQEFHILEQIVRK